MENTTPQDLVAQAKDAVPVITCEELKKLRTEDKKFVLIDVREEGEFQAGHIDGALHIPRGVLEFKIGEAVPDENDLIVVQCVSGGRSALCGQTLQRPGYTNVKNLEGGYTHWCKS